MSIRRHARQGPGDCSSRPSPIYQVPSRPSPIFCVSLKNVFLCFLNRWMSIKRRGIVCDVVRWYDMKMLCIIHFSGTHSFWLFLVAALDWQCLSSEVPAQAVWPQIFGRSQIFATWSKKVCWPCSRGSVMRASQRREVPWASRHHRTLRWGLGVSCSHWLHTSLSVAKASHGLTVALSFDENRAVVEASFWFTWTTEWLSSTHSFRSPCFLCLTCYFIICLRSVSVSLCPLSSPVADFTGRSTSSRPPLPCTTEGASSQVSDVVVSLLKKGIKAKITFSLQSCC